jgi:hypothetical protein
VPSRRQLGQVQLDAVPLEGVQVDAKLRIGVVLRHVF